MVNKKFKNRGSMGMYTDLVSQKKQINEKADTMNREKPMRKPEKEKREKGGKRMRPLPEAPIPRFFAHFRWERIRAYWFSLAGLKRIGKIFAAFVLLGIIGVGALFVYYKNQLKEIQLNDLTIAETVNTYLDRNGNVLWEDKGDADYRLVVDADDISPHVRHATVAIEDRNFYSHPGVDIFGLARAALSTLSGKGVQGGSTLTQQLIKQVYFADEAASENRGGLSRKIKELILSIELEKMYSKEQIITMYLNESPYGGRRNGIESAAQTYFGKSAKELTLAESALLASVPNNPGVLNPYNTYGNDALILRQHKTLDVMAELGYITAEEAEEAKAVPILDQILPESNQYTNIKAPHFVMEVKKQLEEKYPEMKSKGGFTIKTTLDLRAQEIAEAAVRTGDALRNTNRSDNIAMTSLDVETSQVIAMVGSINWETPIYGEVNAATAPLEPGSTIKPLLDYAPLFSLTGDKVYGPGTLTLDENIDSFYCAGFTGACSLGNATGKFHGQITFRESLSNSLNIGAVKALAIVGIDNGLETLHKLGDVSYCQDSAAGLSMAIGSGCTVRMVEHANAYTTVARGGGYKDLVYVLEVKASGGKVLESWKDVAAERVIDEQVAYELSSVLSDAAARAKYNFGSQSYSFGFIVPGVWTASKTGTTTTASSSVAKDSWMVSYSTAVTTVVWNGNHDGSGLSSSTNQIVRRVANDYMERVHKEIYAEDGRWKEGDQPVRPAGIKELKVAGRTDIWPSWYNEEKGGITKEKMMFNSVNGKKAAECTPESLQIEVEVTKIVDPISGSETIIVDEPYDPKEEDTCVDIPSGEGAINILRLSDSLFITFNAFYDLKTYEIVVDGVHRQSGEVNSFLSFDLSGGEKKVEVRATDKNGHTYKHEYRL